MSVVAACLMDDGSLFHNIGAAIINAQSPIVLVFNALLAKKNTVTITALIIP